MYEYSTVTTKDISEELDDYLRTRIMLANIDFSSVGKFNVEAMRVLMGDLGRLGEIVLQELVRQGLTSSDITRTPTDSDLKKELGILFGIDIDLKMVNIDRFSHCLLELLQVVVVEDSLYMRSNKTGIYEVSNSVLKRIIIRILNYVLQDSWSDNKENAILSQLLRLSPDKALASFNKNFFIVGDKALNLNTLEIVPICDNQFCTFKSSYTPIEGDTPEFDRFLKTTFDDTAVGEFIWEWLGSNLDCSRPNGNVLFCISSGASGKSTLLSVIRELVGPANVCGASIQSLASNFGLQPLYGKSALLCDESSNEKFPAATVKALCTGAQQTVNRKYEKAIEVTLPISMTFAFNIAPVAEDTIGFERRLLYLVFPHVFRGDTADKYMEEKIHKELNAIMYKAILGLRRFRENGSFSESAQMIEDKQQYLNRAKSPVQLFLKEVGETKIGVSTHPRGRFLKASMHG